MNWRKFFRWMSLGIFCSGVLIMVAGAKLDINSNIFPFAPIISAVVALVVFISTYVEALGRISKGLIIASTVVFLFLFLTMFTYMLFFGNNIFDQSYWKVYE